MAIKSKKVRITARQKNKYRIRKRVSGHDSHPRLSVFRSSKHMYAQLISDETGKTIASASTLEQEVIDAIPSAVEAASKFAETKGEAGETIAVGSSRSNKSIAAGLAVGKVLAERAKKNNITSVVFDRNGFVYHGRIRAVAEGARAGGLNF